MSHEDDLIAAMHELRAELRRLRSSGVVARLSEAELEEIAARVFERVDERLAPRERPLDDEAPRRRTGRARRI